MATPVLQFKRGAFTQLPALKAGEPGFTTDKFDFFIGLDNTLANNKFFGSHRYWTKETASTGSGLNLVEGTSNGTDFITLQSPANLTGIVTYTLPGTQGASGSVLRNDGSGTLSWSSTGFTLTDTILTGITTISGTSLDVNVDSDFSGITTFSNTTESTNKDTGAVVVEGGVGIEKNLSVGGATTITGNLFVGGTSEFVGVVTFRGGTINIGDADTDDINVAGEFISNLIPNLDDTFDIGQGVDPKRWRHANFAGIGTFATGAVADGLQLGITAANEIDTASGNLTLDSAGGIVTIDDHLAVTGVSTFTGAIDANGGATVDNIQIGITGDNEIDTSTGNLTIDSAGGIVTIDDHLAVTGVSTFTGAIDANGGATVDNIQIGITGDNEIDTSTGNLTLDSAGGITIIDDQLSVTGISTFSSDLVISSLTNQRVLLAGASSQITDSGSLTFDGTTLTVATDVNATSLEASNIKAKDGTASITIADSTGVVAISTNLTVAGNLFVTGSSTEVNTETLLVEDKLIEVGLINSAGSLVPPTSDLNLDIGVIFHYFDSSAKQAAVYWDDSASRIAIASSVTESVTNVLSSVTYADLEIGKLFINDLSGSTAGIGSTVLFFDSGKNQVVLENTLIDCGTF